MKILPSVESVPGPITKGLLEGIKGLKSQGILEEALSYPLTMTLLLAQVIDLEIYKTKSMKPEKITGLFQKLISEDEK